MWKAIVEQVGKLSYWALSLVGGLILLLLAYCQVDDWKNVRFTVRPNPPLPLLVVGIGLLIASLGAFLLSDQLGPAVSTRHVRRTPTGYALCVGKAMINVILGRIEEMPARDGSAVVLPANEYFDDECIDDGRSALGAHLRHAHPALTTSWLGTTSDAPTAARPHGPVKRPPLLNLT